MIALTSPEIPTSIPLADKKKWAVTQYKSCATTEQAGIYTLICPLLGQQPITIQRMDYPTCAQWNASICHK